MKLYYHNSIISDGFWHLFAEAETKEQLAALVKAESDAVVVQDCMTEWKLEE
jgi:hypothetical protein